MQRTSTTGKVRRPGRSWGAGLGFALLRVLGVRGLVGESRARRGTAAAGIELGDDRDPGRAELGLEERRGAQADTAVAAGGPVARGIAEVSEEPRAREGPRGAPLVDQLEGTLLLPDGLPVANVPVWLRLDVLQGDRASFGLAERLRIKNLEQGRSLDYTGEDGSFLFEELVPGQYSVRAGSESSEALPAAVGGDPVVLTVGPGLGAGLALVVVLDARQVALTPVPLHDDWSVEPEIEVSAYRTADADVPPLNARRTLPRLELMPLERLPDSPGVQYRGLVASDVLGLELQLQDAAGRGLPIDVSWPQADYRPTLEVVQEAGEVFLKVLLELPPDETCWADIAVMTVGDAVERDVSGLRSVLERTSAGLHIELQVPAGPLELRAYRDGHSPPPEGLGTMSGTRFPARQVRFEGRPGERVELRLDFPEGGWLRFFEGDGLSFGKLVARENGWPDLRDGAGNPVQEGLVAFTVNTRSTDPG